MYKKVGAWFLEPTISAFGVGTTCRETFENPTKSRTPLILVRGDMNKYLPVGFSHECILFNACTRISEYAWLLPRCRLRNEKVSMHPLSRIKSNLFLSMPLVRLSDDDSESTKFGSRTFKYWYCILWNWSFREISWASRWLFRSIHTRLTSVAVMWTASFGCFDFSSANTSLAKVDVPQPISRI